MSQLVPASSFQSLPPDLIFSVMGYLDSFSVFRMERLNTKFNKALTKNKQIDRLIYGNLILNELQILPTWWKESSSEMIKQFYVWNIDWKNWLNEQSMLDLLLEKNGRFRTLLKDFYLNPFGLVQESTDGKYKSDNSSDYFKVGGVVEFSKWKPCGLIEKLLQNFKTSELFQVRIHTLLLFSSICEWSINRNVIHYFQLTLTDSSNVRKLPGQFVLCFTKDEVKNVRIISNVEGADSIDYELFCKTKSKYESCEVDMIFEKTNNPPYGMKANSATVIEALKVELYEADSFCLNWSPTISNRPWCSYWNSGLEWWGCYAMSSFNSKECAFIIATASCSD